MKLLRRWLKRPAALPVAKHDLERLKARVGLLAKDDPLWPLLLAWLSANVKTETENLARPAVGDEEAHRCRGRVGMCLDLEEQLNRLWQDSHRE